MWHLSRAGSAINISKLLAFFPGSMPSRKQGCSFTVIAIKVVYLKEGMPSLSSYRGRRWQTFDYLDLSHAMPATFLSPRL